MSRYDRNSENAMPGPERPLGQGSSEERIRESLANMVREADFDSVTVRELALRSGVNEVTIYRIFGSRDVLAAAYWSKNIERLEKGIRSDRARFGDPLERITSHLRRLARVATEDRPATVATVRALHTAAFGGSKMGNRDPRELVPLPEIATQLFDDAQRFGVVRDDYPPPEVSAFVTDVMMHRFLAKIESPANELARSTINLAFSGILTEPGDPRPTGTT